MDQPTQRFKFKLFISANPDWIKLKCLYSTCPNSKFSLQRDKVFLEPKAFLKIFKYIIGFHFLKIWQKENMK